MTLVIPDFTQPHRYNRRMEVHGQVLYVPRDITLVNNHWRIARRYRTTEIRCTNPIKSLEDAWLLLQSRHALECPDKRPPGVDTKKELDTGVLGVRISVTGGHCRVWTQQKLAPNKHRQCPVGSIALDKLNQDWLNSTLAMAVSIRQYYLRLSEQVSVCQAIRYSDVPTSLRMSEPTRRVPVVDVLLLASEKETAVERQAV